MRELSNIENDPNALMALSAEIVDFATHARYLLIPSTEHLTDAVILLRRLVLISHKVLPIKSYFNLLRDLQRIVMTSAVLASEKTQHMPDATPEQVEKKRAAYEQYDAQFRASLAAHPAGQIEGEKIAAMVRHQLCTEDVFCAACAFLQLEVSRRGSIYYIRGESPEFLETKKNRDPIPMDNEVTLKTLASNLARPDAVLGAVEKTQIAYGFNLLAKLYQLFVKMPLVIQWIKEGEHLANPRRMVDVRAHFNLTLRDYDTIMVMARQMGLSVIKSRKSGSSNKYTLNQKVEERVLAEAERRGYTPNRVLNVLLLDFFMLIDARHRAEAIKKAKQDTKAEKPASKASTKKGARHGEAGRKRRT